MMPPYSCCVPQRKPGTSTRVTRGMLNASQKRTKRAALREAFMSSTPARIFGWFATMPTERPFMCANPTMMFFAQLLWTSRNFPSSTMLPMTWYMSYALFGLSGIMSLRASSTRPAGSAVSTKGASSRLFEGRKLRRALMVPMPSCSFFAAKCATPLFDPCTLAPPSSSCETVSPVTVFTTPGPVRNIYEVSLIMTVKSVRAGEYTAPPAHGPKMPDICGITPDARIFLSKISPNPAREQIPSWILAPPESLMPMKGAPLRTAMSMTLLILRAIVSDMEPPVTVKSCANTYTRRPSIVPIPVTTPSPSNFVFSIPKFVQRCWTNMSNSSKLPSSRSIASLSRAVNLPFACWASILF